MSLSKPINSNIQEKKDNSKYCFYPMKNKILFSYYEKLKNSFWIPSEIIYKGDRLDWENSSYKDIVLFLEHILAFFAQADGKVNENLLINFQRETSDVKEATAFYNMQIANETIHNETYSIQIDTFIQNPDRKQKVLNAIDNFPAIKEMADWFDQFLDTKIPLMERIIAISCTEGIFFTSGFAPIYWVKRLNIFPGLTKANEWIARDEAIHTEFPIALYHHYTRIMKKYDAVPQERVHAIIKSSVNVAEKFVRSALKVDLIGMNVEDLVKHIQYTADCLAQNYGYDAIYNVESPFDWMVMIELKNITNFFEDTVTEYSKVKDDSRDFTTEAEF